MNNIVHVKLRCPKCGSYVNARLVNRPYKFLIYRCIECGSNVVFYENRVDILSDEFVKMFIKDKRLRFYGNALFSRNSVCKHTHGGRYITEDMILDLRILLNTETDFNQLISKL